MGGLDHGGYPAFNREGKLYRRLPKGGKTLADVTGLEPDPSPPPEWAKQRLPFRATPQQEPRRQQGNRGRLLSTSGADRSIYQNAACRRFTSLGSMYLGLRAIQQVAHFDPPDC